MYYYNQQFTETRETRKPVCDKIGDKTSLGVLFMDAEVLNECRVRSGAPEVYDKEYAVWYSTHDVNVQIGKHSLVISRPYAFYNANQTTSAVSVEQEPEDRHLLHATYKELRSKYKGVIESGVPDEFNNAIHAIVCKYYAMAYYNNDLSPFIPYATAELCITDDSVEVFREEAVKNIQKHLCDLYKDVVVDSNEYKELAQEYTQQVIDSMVFEEACELNIKHLIKNPVATDFSDEEVNEAAMRRAVDELFDLGQILPTFSDDITDDVMEDIISNEKLAFRWGLNSLHSLHAHPTDCNAFSGANIQGDVEEITGTSGDLKNDYKEVFDTEKQEWVQAANAQLGIVYQYVADEFPAPIPTYAGVIQQINKETTLAFNEMRMYKCNREAGEDNYYRTPLLTYVKGYIPELKEGLPKISAMLGKKVPEEGSKDYIVPYLGASTSEMTEELFDVFLQHQIDVLYDIDSHRVAERTTSHYSGYTDKHKTTYPNKKKLIKWLLDKVKVLFPTKKYTKASLGKLNSANLRKLADTVLVSLLFANDNKSSRRVLEDMHKVFTMYKEDLFAFAEHRKNDARSTKVIEYFLSNNCPTMYQWERLSNNELSDIIGKTNDEVTAMMRTSISTNVRTKTNFPILSSTLNSECLALGLPMHGSYQNKLTSVKNYIYELFHIPKGEQQKFWGNLELLDIDFTELTDISLQYVNLDLVERVSLWSLDSKDTEDLLSIVDSYLDILWLDTEELVKNLIDARREGKIPFNKAVVTQHEKARYLTVNHSVTTVAKGNTRFGVHIPAASAAVDELFRELYTKDLAKILPNLKDVMTIIDELELNPVELIKHDKVKEILNSINTLDTATLKYVTKYTNNPSDILYYTEEDLAAFSVTSSSSASSSIGVTVDIEYSKALELLSAFGILTHTTTISNKEVEVAINETNAHLVVTDLVIEYLGADLSQEDIKLLITNINTHCVDVQLLLELPQQECDEYIATLLANKVNYTKVPYKKVVNGMEYFFVEINKETKNISLEEYNSLCTKLCVITDIFITDDGDKVAVLNSGFKFPLSTNSSDGKIGDICHPTLR